MCPFCDLAPGPHIISLPLLCSCNLATGDRSVRSAVAKALGAEPPRTEGKGDASHGGWQQRLQDSRVAFDHSITRELMQMHKPTLCCIGQLLGRGGGVNRPHFRPPVV
jgi:hypothetical protein